MKILLVANYLPDAQQSMQRYATLLQEGLTAAGHDVRVIRPAVKAGKLAPNESGVKWLGYLDKLVLFPGLLRNTVEWADIVHICDHSNAVYMKHLQGRPHVVTCHDLIAIRRALGEMPHLPIGSSGRQLQRMILDGVRRARNIVCVSDATRADVRRILGGGNVEISRIYNGLNYPYKPMDGDQAASHLRKAGLAPNQTFILHVGGNNGYKNRLGVLNIFAHLRKRWPLDNLVLVMAGKPWTEEMRQFAKQHELGGSAVEFIDATEMDLQALYSHAEVLLFPSLEEGFGWPIAEAQSCGCPVVTSNRAPMTEVGGDAASYIDPLDPEAAAAVVAGVIGSRTFSREANLRNAVRFNPPAMIDAYILLYKRILNRNASPDGTGPGLLESRQLAGQFAS